MYNNFIEDGKVVGSASMAVLLGYADIFNHLITLAISLCTLIYVANRAYKSLIVDKKISKRRKKRK